MSRLPNPLMTNSPRWTASSSRWCSGRRGAKRALRRPQERSTSGLEKFSIPCRKSNGSNRCLEFYILLVAQAILSPVSYRACSPRNFIKSVQRIFTQLGRVFYPASFGPSVHPVSGKSVSRVFNDGT